MKKCSRCKAELPPERKCNYCKSCKREYDHERLERQATEAGKPPPRRNRERALQIGMSSSDPHYMRAYRLQYTYGITLADYRRMLHWQGGKCAICRRSPPKGKRLYVDHDHATGAVRGLLCNGCNVALGVIESNPARVRAAKAYMRAARLANMQRDSWQGGKMCDTIGAGYDDESVREALRAWGDDAPDPDSDRRADLERALASLRDTEVYALRLWSWGYPGKDIAARVLPGKSYKTAERLIARLLAVVRTAMNGMQRGTPC